MYLRSSAHLVSLVWVPESVQELSSGRIWLRQLLVTVPGRFQCQRVVTWNSAEARAGWEQGSLRRGDSAAAANGSTGDNDHVIGRCLLSASCMLGAFLLVQRERIHLPVQEMQVWPLGWEGPLQKEMATHSSILAWEIPWAQEPGGAQPTGLQRVGHDWAHVRTQE